MKQGQNTVSQPYGLTKNKFETKNNMSNMAITALNDKTQP